MILQIALSLGIFVAGIGLTIPLFIAIDVCADWGLGDGRARKWISTIAVLLIALLCIAVIAGTFLLIAHVWGVSLPV